MDIPRGGVLDNYLANPKHGPLPALLLLLTVGTGLVDAISILGLGRVFVANMTGNIVFIGFALAGAPGFSIWGSLVALAAFLVGASGGGALVARFATHRGRLLRNALILEVVLFGIALLLSALTGSTGAQLAILAVAALALGIQNAVVRQLAVPDMTTTVLTMTLTGIGSDLRKRDLSTAARRLLTVVSMLVGALVGALVVIHLGVTAALVAVVVVFAVALTGAIVSSRAESDWAVQSSG